MKRSLLAGVFLALALFPLSPSERPLAAGAGAGPSAAVPAITVIHRALLGGYAEDITYISGGQHKGFIAMKVGQEVLGIKLSGNNPEPIKLFDLTEAGYLPFRPTGMVYVGDLDRFVLSQGAQAGWPEFMYVFDSRGRLEAWPVDRAGATPPSYTEGLAYIPSDALVWGEGWRGRLLMMVPGPSPRVELLKAEDRTFTLERQISLPAGYNWGDVVPLPSGELLVSAYGECSVYRWNPASPAIFTPEPVEPCDGSLGEGMIVLPDSRVVMSTLPLRLMTFPLTPASGVWTAASTKDVRIGLGMLFFPVGLAWDSTRQQFLVRYDTSFGTSPRGYGNALATLPLSLTRWTPWRVLSTDPASADRFFGGMTYDSLLDAAVVARRGRAEEDFPQPPLPGWVHTRTPALLQVPMADPNLPLTTIELGSGLKALAESAPYPKSLYNKQSWGNGPFAVSFLADEAKHGVRFNAGGPRIFVLEPNVIDSRCIDVSVTCSDPAMSFGSSQFAAAPEPVAGARFAVLGSCRKPGTGPATVGPPLLVLLDESGHELFHIELLRDLGLMSLGSSYVTFVTSGPQTGAIAVFDSEFQRLVVFRVK